MKRSTKQAILDAAEELFADYGFAATSLRAITAAAQVNLAAVNYHFGSKEALIDAVFARRVEPMNRARLEALHELQTAFVDAIVPLDRLIAAFVEPALALSHDRTLGGQRFVRLLGRSLTEPAGAVHDSLRGRYVEVSEQFKSAFARTLPELPAVELYWRMHFMVGLLAYLMAGVDIMRLIASSRMSAHSEYDAVLPRLVSFIEAGMRAPVNADDTVSDLHPVSGAQL
ncbi:MAG: TetR family transcriptional regulator [Gammaproteobacteria bacterium]|nr:TetR family transcriptional regulator [Gammaproteobacteria bacterium]